MIPWKPLDRARVPGSGSELVLYQRGDEFSIRVDGRALMNSRVYASEDELAVIACARVRDCKDPHLLIGGLGMGYTLATALGRLGARAKVVVAELVPSVVGWNRTHFGHFTGHPLRDKRVSVREEDVGRVMRSQPGAYDAILLDVDNGPEGLTRTSNDRLYAQAGIAEAIAALRPGGVLAVWSAGTNGAFVARLRRAGLAVDEVAVRSRGRRGGARHTLWFATRRQPR
jgi:spermidine synthase